MTKLPNLKPGLPVLDMRSARPVERRDDPIAQAYHTPEWRALAEACKRRDDYRCTDPVCKTPDRGYGGRLIADHIIPKREGGADELGNLRTLCPPCDNRRHAEKGIR